MEEQFDWNIEFEIKAYNKIRRPRTEDVDYLVWDQLGALISKMRSPRYNYNHYNYNILDRRTYSEENIKCLFTQSKEQFWILYYRTYGNQHLTLQQLSYIKCRKNKVDMKGVPKDLIKENKKWYKNHPISQMETYKEPKY